MAVANRPVFAAGANRPTAVTIAGKASVALAPVAVRPSVQHAARLHVAGVVQLAGLQAATLPLSVPLKAHIALTVQGQRVRVGATGGIRVTVAGDAAAQVEDVGGGR